MVYVVKNSFRSIIYSWDTRIVARYDTPTRVHELDVGTYLRVGQVKVENRGFGNIYRNLDTGARIR